MDFKLTSKANELTELVRIFTKNEIIPFAMEMDKNNEIYPGLLKKASQLGLFSLMLPVEYGGIGLQATEIAPIYEELAKGCAGVATTFAASSLASLPILIAGNKIQKQKLSKILQSGGLGAFALTEQNAGSDAGGIATSAKFDENNNTYTINGTKCFITNGGLADFFIILANIRQDRSIRGITAFFVEKNTPGLSIGKKEDKMGIRPSNTTEVFLNNVIVSTNAVIGKPGFGFQLAMKALDIARPFAGILAVGVAQAALDCAINYAKNRKQFNKPIYAFEMVQSMISDMAMKIESSRLLIYKALWLYENGFDFSKESAMAKCFASDMAMQVTTDAVQIMGGYGYSKEYPVEKYMRDAKVMQIYEGTNQIQRLLIAGKMLKC